MRQAVFFLVLVFMFLLQVEEQSFLVGPRSIAAQCAVCVDDTMARDDDGNGVVVVGLSDGT